MPTYATAAELTAHAAGTAYEGRIPADPGRLLELAERDLDSECFPLLEADETTGRKHVLGDLDAQEKAALSRATCAQAIYRIEMGDEHFVRAQRQRVRARHFDAEGVLPIVGPEASRELAAGGLFRLSTSVGRRRQRDRWQAED